jgi:hypothetical protein
LDFDEENSTRKLHLSGCKKRPQSEKSRHKLKKAALLLIYNE